MFGSDGHIVPLEKHDLFRRSDSLSEGHASACPKFSRSGNEVGRAEARPSEPLLVGRYHVAMTQGVTQSGING
jgi:hypothetical protein